MIAHGDIVVNNVDTKENSIDMLTKAFPIVKFEQCMDLDGICC